MAVWLPRLTVWAVLVPAAAVRTVRSTHTVAVFLVRDAVLYTPELTSCLEGITRDSIFRIAADQGLTVREKRITRDEVYVADEAFFTGTAAEVVPIREVDHRTIGSGARGPITEKLQSIYLEAVRGEQPQYAEWLAPVAD